MPSPRWEPASGGRNGDDCFPTPADFGRQILCDDGGHLRRGRLQRLLHDLLAAGNARHVQGSAMLHLHGLLFTLWTLFFLSQALLVANGGLRHHKAWGLAGISLATAMVFVGITVAVTVSSGDWSWGMAMPPALFHVRAGLRSSPVWRLVAAAVANLRNPEWHKRFMLVATAALLQPAIARYFSPCGRQGRCRPRQAGPPPPSNSR